jgi:hypothetical protein
MTAADLLADLSARSVRLSAVEGRLRVEAPAGTLSDADRQALAAHKADLLALLRPPCEALLDFALAEVLELVEQARARTTRPARQSVLDQYAAVARRYRNERNSYLFLVRGAVGALMDRWREEDHTAARPKAG